jgi:hypothetical protein
MAFRFICFITPMVLFFSPETLITTVRTFVDAAPYQGSFQNFILFNPAREFQV